MMWMVIVMSQFMIRKKNRKVPYKEQTGFFRPDYGRPQGDVNGDEGCLSEEEIYGYDD